MNPDSSALDNRFFPKTYFKIDNDRSAQGRAYRFIGQYKRQAPTKPASAAIKFLIYLSSSAAAKLG